MQGNFPEADVAAADAASVALDVMILRTQLHA
jgi:hypothetical protein